MDTDHLVQSWHGRDTSLALHHTETITVFVLFDVCSREQSAAAMAGTKPNERTLAAPASIDFLPIQHHGHTISEITSILTFLDVMVTDL